MTRALVGVLLAAVLTACSSGGVDVRPPDVDVDTPALREVKASIGMEDCVPGDGAAVPGGLPAVTLPCLGGGPDIDLSALRGPLVINLWQSNCGPCRLEMPALEAFHQKYGDQVRVLGIDFNDVRPGAALQLAQDTKATYPSIADPGGDLMTEAAFAVVRRGLPGFVFVDETGAVVGQDSGGVDSVEEIKALVAEHLGITL